MKKLLLCAALLSLNVGVMLHGSESAANASGSDVADELNTANFLTEVNLEIRDRAQPFDRVLGSLRGGEKLPFVDKDTGKLTRAGDQVIYLLEGFLLDYISRRSREDFDAKIQRAINQRYEAQTNSDDYDSDFDPFG